MRKSGRTKRIWLAVLAGILAFVLLDVALVAIYGRSPVTGQRWGITNLAERFPSHENFVRLAAMTRDSTCVRLLQPPVQRERKLVFAWDIDHPWSPSTDTLNSLPVRKLASPVNRALSRFAQTSVPDTFITITFPDDTLDYILYAQREAPVQNATVNAAVMEPLFFIFSFFEAGIDVSKHTSLGQIFPGWSAVGQATHQFSSPYWPSTISSEDSTFGIEGVLDTVRIDYGDALTYEIIGKESPVASLWRMIPGRR